MITTIFSSGNGAISKCTGMTNEDKKKEKGLT